MHTHTHTVYIHTVYVAIGVSYNSCCEYSLVSRMHRFKDETIIVSGKFFLP